MPTEIQQTIHETIRQIVHLDKVEEQLKVTRAELKSSLDEHQKIDQLIGQELRDIERLEGLSTKAIFYKLLGSKEERLEKERQEYLKLALREEDIQKSIKLLEYESDLLEAKLFSKADLVKQLDNLKLNREQEIINQDPILRNKLLKISDKIESSYRDKTKIEEAIEKGTVCHNLTNQIIGYLSQVRNRGKWSSGQNKGALRKKIRRDAIARARNLSYQVRHHLNLFDKKLRDIGKHITFSANTSDFTDFSAFFFNNIITDWIVNKQLTKAIASAVSLSKNLKSLLGQLKLEKENMEREVVVLSEEREQILIS